jgi:hypothetical protein
VRQAAKPVLLHPAAPCCTRWRRALTTLPTWVAARADLAASFFVGDMGGRPGDKDKTDRKFAEAVGLGFKSPEDVFGCAPRAPARTLAPAAPGALRECKCCLGLSACRPAPQERKGVAGRFLARRAPLCCPCRAADSGGAPAASPKGKGKAEAAPMVRPARSGQPGAPLALCGQRQWAANPCSVEHTRERAGRMSSRGPWLASDLEGQRAATGARACAP